MALRKAAIMTNSIYLTTIEPHGGKSLISLEVLSAALRATRRVGIFRPVISNGNCAVNPKPTALQVKIHLNDI